MFYFILGLFLCASTAISSVAAYHYKTEVQRILGKMKSSEEWSSRSVLEGQEWNEFLRYIKEDCRGYLLAQ